MGHLEAEGPGEVDVLLPVRDPRRVQPLRRRLDGATPRERPAREGADRTSHRAAANHFKTLKYRPEFPERFDDIEHACAHCRQFFHWYNYDHRHSGIGLMTPAAIHNGQAPALHADTRPRPPGRLRAQPRAVRSQAARAARTADRRLDQQARHEGGRSPNSNTKRLTELDRLRASCRSKRGRVVSREDCADLQPRDTGANQLPSGDAATGEGLRCEVGIGVPVQRVRVRSSEPGGAHRVV